MITYLRRTTCGAAGYGLSAAMKYLRGAVGIGLGATIKSLRRITAGSGMDTTIKYLVNQNAGAGNNWANAHYTQDRHELSNQFLATC